MFFKWLLGKSKGKDDWTCCGGRWIWSWRDCRKKSGIEVLRATIDERSKSGRRRIEAVLIVDQRGNKGIRRVIWLCPYYKTLLDSNPTWWWEIRTMLRMGWSLDATAKWSDKARLPPVKWETRREQFWNALADTYGRMTVVAVQHLIRIVEVFL